MSIASTFVLWWRSFRSFIMGHDDYEPEKVYEKDPRTGREQKVNDPTAVEFRRRRAEAIRGLRAEQRLRGSPPPKPVDPHTGQPISNRVVLALVSPGRRVPWEPVVLPGGYSMDDMGEGRITYTGAWAADLIRGLEAHWLRMDAKIELYDRGVGKRKAERAEARRQAALARAEREYEKAIARELREKETE